ncbi:uncharacterized protein LOC127057557 isoform X4 [Gopherus flavomarginatus]|nr:uncharacterized protein LOC127057557 isoform X4 [Gopherus flavomarginatus]
MEGPGWVRRGEDHVYMRDQKRHKELKKNEPSLCPGLRIENKSAHVDFTRVSLLLATTIDVIWSQESLFHLDFISSR